MRLYLFLNCSKVTVKAIPGLGYGLDYWSGDLSGSTNPDTIIIDGNKTITANLKTVPVYTLTTSATNGKVSPAGGACFVVAGRLGAGQGTQVLCAVAVTFFLRILAMKYGISLPHVRSLPASPSQLTRLRKAKHETEQNTSRKDD
jgi:hypothetical protein